MNDTYYESEDIDGKTVCIDDIISLATISSLFIVSEILPFIKSLKGNGLVDLVICLLNGSECCLSKLIEYLKIRRSVSQEQQQSLHHESVNININAERNVDNK